MKKNDNLFEAKKLKKPLTKGPAFPFVLELLAKCKPYVRPMFGCHSVYIREKIVLILRDRESSPQDNGVWLATTTEHHLSLKDDFPSMRSISVFGPGATGWQVLPKNSKTFETEVTLACEYILKNDPRIGKIPAVKKMKPTDQKPRARKRVSKQKRA